MRKIYQVKFVMDNGRYTDLPGFVLDKHHGKFDGGMDIGLFWHDILEHWFEDTRFFKQESETQCGEVVAMGIRQYLYENTDCRYMSTNTYYGVYWNTASVLSGQIKETKEQEREYGNAQFPNIFDFEGMASLKKEAQNLTKFQDNILEKYHKMFTDIQEFVPSVTLAYNYGYALGRYIFTPALLYSVGQFMDNLKSLISELEDLWMWEPEYLNGATLSVNVTDRKITGQFNYTDPYTGRSKTKKIKGC